MWRYNKIPRTKAGFSSRQNEFQIEKEWLDDEKVISLTILESMVHGPQISVFFSCWPVESQHVGLEKLNRRIEHLSGLHADSSKGYSEGFMVGKII